jgi:hypothetical protein
MSSRLKNQSVYLLVRLERYRAAGNSLKNTQCRARMPAQDTDATEHDNASH